MTDKEIIEALECCTHDSTYCPKCPMDGNSYCRGELIEYSYDLIKRQTAEIEQLRQLFVESGKEQDRLMAEIERLEGDLAFREKQLDNLGKELEAEKIRSF